MPKSENLIIVLPTTNNKTAIAMKLSTENKFPEMLAATTKGTYTLQFWVFVNKKAIHKEDYFRFVCDKNAYNQICEAIAEITENNPPDTYKNHPKGGYSFGFDLGV